MNLKPHLLRRMGAEFTGTYFLVTAGCGAIIVGKLSGALSHMGIALTFGLIVTVMIAALGHISGAHFNPVVTLALAGTRRFSWLEVLPYIAAQLFGATLGAYTLRLLFGLTANLGMTLPQGGNLQSLGMEILLTAILMLVIVSVAADQAGARLLTPLVIGATVTLNALWGGSISGASMNPARSFGPAFVAGVWSYHWIYWVGPILGAALGVFIFQFIRLPSPDSE
jgi:aquaporin NIP